MKEREGREGRRGGRRRVEKVREGWGEIGDGEGGERGIVGGG